MKRVASIRDEQKQHHLWQQLWLQAGVKQPKDFNGKAETKVDAIWTRSAISFVLPAWSQGGPS